MPRKTGDGGIPEDSSLLQDLRSPRGDRNDDTGGDYEDDEGLEGDRDDFIDDEPDGGIDRAAIGTMRAPRDDDAFVEIIEDRRPDDDEPGDGAAVDSDLKPYGKKVRDRIMRERRLRLRAVADYRGQLAAERGRRIAAEETMLGSIENSLKAQIEQKKEALIAAEEDGKTADKVQLTRELAALDRQMHDLEINKVALKQEKERGIELQLTPQQTEQKKTLVADWMKANPWFNDPASRSAKYFAMGVDQELVAEGYSPSDPEFYREMNNRIAARFPDLVEPTGETDPPARRGFERDQRRQSQPPRQQPRQQPRSPVARPGAGGPQYNRPRVQGNRVTITRSDAAAMRLVNLDPNNFEHAKAYAAEIASESRGGGFIRR